MFYQSLLCDDGEIFDVTDKKCYNVQSCTSSGGTWNETGKQCSGCPTLSEVQTLDGVSQCVAVANAKYNKNNGTYECVEGYVASGTNCVAEGE